GDALAGRVEGRVVRPGRVAPPVPLAVQDPGARVVDTLVAVAGEAVAVDVDVAGRGRRGHAVDEPADRVAGDTQHRGGRDIALDQDAGAVGAAVEAVHAAAVERVVRDRDA